MDNDMQRYIEAVEIREYGNPPQEPEQEPRYKVVPAGEVGRSLGYVVMDTTGDAGPFLAYPLRDVLCGLDQANSVCRELNTRAVVR